MPCCFISAIADIRGLKQNLHLLAFCFTILVLLLIMLLLLQLIILVLLIDHIAA
jgi:hypothetical protein